MYFHNYIAGCFLQIFALFPYCLCQCESVKCLCLVWFGLVCVEVAVGLEWVYLICAGWLLKGQVYEIVHVQC